jgi:predicted O-linked N-acetylglucosamine transferase (SPINDLY family)
MCMAVASILVQYAAITELIAESGAFYIGWAIKLF